MFFVRTASPRDLEAVSALLAETWHATYDGLYGAEKVGDLTARWHSVPALKARLERRDAEFVVADDGRDIAGMAYAAMMKDRSKTAMLHQLYVRPKFQGQGIGRDLFAELETCFPDATLMRLEVEPQNGRAIAFYEMLGFAKVGETANCGDDRSGIPAWVFEKAIG